MPPLHAPPASFALGVYLALTAALAPAAPALLRRRLARGKEDPARLPERLGRATAPRPVGPLVWFHAASVGESLSLLPLVAAVLDARPDLHALLTTGTRTSAELLASRLPARARHAFVPLDTPGPVRRFLNHWRPDVAVWTESELWPRLVAATHARAIPMLLVNARMSEASARRWRRAPRMLAGLLARFEAVQVQDAATAGLLAGYAPEPARIAVTGALKQGAAPPSAEPGALAALHAAIGARPVWLAASTHPGEEEIVATAHNRLVRTRPDLLLILAPRHPDRGPEVAAQLAAGGLAAPCRSAGAPPAPDAPAYLADTLGEMGLWYRLAPVAFVGGSLVPVGGHNPYEPAALGAAIVAGPHTANFADIFTRLDAAGGVSRVRDAETLAAAVAALLDDPASTAAAARAVATADSGAAAAACAAILARLPAAMAPRPITCPVPRPRDVRVIAPNLKRRLSGVTATIARLVPLQAHEIAIVATGPGLPADVPHLPLWRVALLERRTRRVWHARRNTEMLLGLALRHLLRQRLKLVFTSASQRHHSAYTRWLIGRMDAVIATSARTAAYLERPATVILHGIDTETFAPATDRATLRARLGLPAAGRLVGCYGRIRAQKGTDVFVAAMIAALPTLPDTAALVMGRATEGHGAFLDTLRARVARAGLADRIRFLPEVSVDAMPDWYRVLDLYIAPQRWEGFGLTPLEAMACAVPVLATEVGAFPELVAEGETGHLVPAGDAAAMARAARALLADPARLATMAAAARAHACARFRLEDEAAAITALYRRLLDE